MKRFLAGLILGVIVIPLAVYILIRLGYAPVATSAKPLPFEKWFARTALNARINSEAPAEAGLPPSVENLIAGAKLYRQECAVCHGLPDQKRTAVSAGMFPRPPQLFHGHGVTDDPVGETYWKIANGIRLTGMPAYRGSLDEPQMWQLSQLLAHGNELPQAALDTLHDPFKME